MFSLITSRKPVVRLSYFYRKRRTCHEVFVYRFDLFNASRSKKDTSLKKQLLVRNIISYIPIKLLVRTFFSNLSRKYWCGTFMLRHPKIDGAPSQLFDSMCFEIRIVIN